MAKGKSEGGLPLSEWLDNHIERWTRSEGRIKGQWDGMDKDTNPFYGSWSWMHSLVEETLAILQVMKVQNNKYNTLRRQFIATIGLAEDSTDEEITQTAKTMREIFVEMRRVRGERESSTANET